MSASGIGVDLADEASAEEASRADATAAAAAARSARAAAFASAFFAAFASFFSRDFDLAHGASAGPAAAGASAADRMTKLAEIRRERVAVARMHAAAAAPACAVFDAHSHALGDATLARLGLLGVCFVSTCEDDWPSALAAGPAARVAPVVRRGLGVHPWYVHTVCDGWETRLADTLRAAPDAIVGEIGLDKARKDIPWEVQQRVFGAQLAIASELRRPAVIHCVRAHGPLLDALRAAPALPPAIHLHAYGGSVESAQALLKLPTRAYFGFSAAACRLKRAPAVISSLPAERLLLESDEFTAVASAAGLADARAAVADARGWDEEEAASVTAANARDAFSIESS